MRCLSVGSLLGAAALLFGCGGVETCEEPAFYEYAEPGRRLDSPDDLDNLTASRELVIPEASPRPPRDRSAGCLDRPPTLRITRDEDEEEEG